MFSKIPKLKQITDLPKNASTLKIPAFDLHTKSEVNSSRSSPRIWNVPSDYDANSKEEIEINSLREFKTKEQVDKLKWQLGLM